MNKNEFLADLATKVLAINSTQEGKVIEGTQECKVNVVELRANGTASLPFWLDYTVVNVGVVAGPQTYASDVYNDDVVLDENGDTVTPATLAHSAGDPVLDENGDQIVVSPLFAETAYPARQIALPVGDALTAVGYMTALKDSGAIDGWTYVGGEPPKYSMFKVWITVDANATPPTVREAIYKASYDDEGNPTHVEIV